MIKPYRQGEFDGLCGLYAVLNAIQQHLNVPGQEELHCDLFKVCAAAIPKAQYPDVLWNGMDIDALLKIAKAACQFLREEEEFRFEVKVWRPFKNRRFEKLRDFLNALNVIWSCDRVSFILGIEWARSSSGHWSVLKAIRSDVIELFDSDGQRSLNRHSLCVVPAPKKHKLLPQETVSFKMISIKGEPL